MLKSVDITFSMNHGGMCVGFIRCHTRYAGSIALVSRCASLQRGQARSLRLERARVPLLSCSIGSGN